MDKVVDLGNKFPRFPIGTHSTTPWQVPSNLNTEVYLQLLYETANPILTEIRQSGNSEHISAR